MSSATLFTLLARAPTLPVSLPEANLVMDEQPDSAWPHRPSAGSSLNCVYRSFTVRDEMSGRRTQLDFQKWVKLVVPLVRKIMV